MKCNIKETVTHTGKISLETMDVLPFKLLLYFIQGKEKEFMDENGCYQQDAEHAIHLVEQMLDGFPDVGVE